MDLEEKWGLGGKSELMWSSHHELSHGFGELAQGTHPVGAVSGDSVPQGAAPKGGMSTPANMRRQSVAEP